MSFVAFHRKNPFFRLLLAFAAGLITARLVDVTEWMFAGLTVTVAVLITAMAWTYAAHHRPVAKKAFGWFFLIFLWVTGLVQGTLEEDTEEMVLQQYMKVGVFHAVLLGQPEIRSSTVRVMARIEGEIRGDSLLAANCKALVYFGRDSVAESLEPGSQILFSGEMRRIWQAGNPDEFDYRKYLASRGVYLQVYLPAGSYRVSPADRRIVIRALAARTRKMLLDRYDELELNNIESGVLSALTLGYRDELDAGTRNAFIHAGVMHIMALSGFHVGVVALMLGFLLRPFRRTATGKWTRVAMTLVFLWAFAFVCGLSTSVIRATLMFSLALPGRLFGKKVNIWNMLFASTLVILWCRPGYLTDTGFQLSFLAVAGISFVQPVLSRVPKRTYFPLRNIGRMLIVSAAAQLATLPVTLRCFHQFPLYFLLANLLVIPLAALVLYTGAGFLATGFIKPLALLTGKVLALSVKGLVLVVSGIEKLPFALKEGIDISLAQTFLLLVILWSFGMFILYRRKVLLQTGLAALLAFLAAGTWRDIKQGRQHVLVVNNVSGLTCMHFITGRNCLLLAHPDTMVTQAQLDYSFGSFWTRRGVFGNTIIHDPYAAGPVWGDFVFIRNQFMGDNLFLQFHDLSLAVLKDVLEEVPARAGPLDVDLVVITGTMPFDPAPILRRFDLRMLILDSSVGYYDALRWTEWCSVSMVSCWNVSEQGAFLMDANE